jgi:secreted trypsin-like serine protease
MRLLIGYAAASLALTLTVLWPGLATPARAAETNWMRERVAQWQRSKMERFIGREAAARLKVAPRIVGGNIAAPGRWPFQAALVAAHIADNSHAQYCGASVIHERFILTAAHCVEFLFHRSQIEVLTNTLSLASGGIRHEIEKIRMHSHWAPDTANNDVAVIKLKDKVTGISAGKRARIIASTVEEREFLQQGTEAFVTGWGNMDPGGEPGEEIFPTELHEVQVPIITRKTCNAPVSFDGAVTTRMMCAGLAEGGQDACQGDSGGPLVVPDTDGKPRVQVGVVSWGIGCALPDLYGVYARLATLGAWVKETIANHPN